MSCTHSLYLCVHFCVCRVANTVKPSRCELSQGARRLARLPPLQMQTLPIFAKCFLILVRSFTRATFEQLIILCDLHAFICTLCSYHVTKAPEHRAARVPVRGRSLLCVTLPGEPRRVRLYSVTDSTSTEWSSCSRRCTFRETRLLCSPRVRILESRPRNASSAHALPVCVPYPYVCS